MASFCTIFKMSTMVHILIVNYHILFVNYHILIGSYPLTNTVYSKWTLSVYRDTRVQTKLWIRKFRSNAVLWDSNVQFFSNHLSPTDEPRTGKHSPKNLPVHRLQSNIFMAGPKSTSIQDSRMFKKELHYSCGQTAHKTNTRYLQGWWRIQKNIW